MPTNRDTKFEALLEKARKAKDDERELKKQRREYASELRAWIATDSLSVSEKNEARSLIRGAASKRRRSLSSS
jgi:proline dehydrogenase